MKLNTSISKILTNKLVLNIVSVIAFFNVIGFMVMGNFNSVIFYIILAVLVRYFSKNMIIVLGIPLIIVNLSSLKNTSSTKEGMESNDKQSDTINKINDEKRRAQPAVPVVGSDVSASNVQTDEHFEVGRPKNGGSKIDYASTIENAYDELNKVLGSDGIKSLTDDTQRLMKQQMDLAKSMEGLTPIVEKMMPMASKMQEMMESMNSGGGGGMTNLMDMAQKMAKGLGGANKSQ
jgi:hypothetical protein